MTERLSTRFRKAASALFGFQQSGGALGFLGGTTPPRRGSKELLDAYNNMPWLRAVVNRIGRATADTQWTASYINRGGKAVKVDRLVRAPWQERQKAFADYRKAGELVQIESHPLLDLLTGANMTMGQLAFAPALTSITIRQVAQQYLDLVGECFWLKERNGLGKPFALWPIPPHWILDIPNPARMSYRMSFGSWQGEIPASEMLWLVDPDPTNPYGRGSGISRALADELETDEYAAKHVKSWFYNRARPDLIISSDGLQPGDTKRLEERWLEHSQGFWKSYKPFFLSKKVDIQQLNQTFESLQLVDLRKFERDTMIQTFGMSLEILGIIENSNRATIESADYLFSRWVVQPRQETMRHFFQERLVPEFDDRIILDYVSPIQEDKEYNLKVAMAAPWSLQVDQWRAMMSLPPLDNDAGKVFMVPFSLVPMQTLQAPPRATITPIPIPPPAAPAPLALEEQAADVQKAIAPAQQSWLKKLLALLDGQDLREYSELTYKETVAHFGQAMMELVAPGIAFDLMDPRVVEFVNREAFKYIKDINETTVQMLRDTLSQGLEGGESMAKLAKRVSTTFTEAKGYRAVLIAQTESCRASSFGSHEGMKQAAVEYKEWITTMDGNARDSHEALDEKVVMVDEPFVSISGAEGQYPGDFNDPAEDCNCRCAVAPVVNIDSFMQGERKAAYWKTNDAALTVWERRMKTAYIKGFQSQQDKVMTMIKEGAE